VDRALGGVTSLAWRQVARVLPAAAGVAVFAAALQMLHRELEAVTWGALSADVARTSPALIAWAASLTALNYAVLTGYDFLAFASIGKRLARARVAATAFLAYAVAQQRRLRGRLGCVGPLPVLLARRQRGREAASWRR
jgi:uncharacterized membrane protein YbhN (UPF0104 family)